MSRLNIDTGTLGNPATGDTLRTAMTKVNTNFEEVYQLIGNADDGLITTTITNGDLKLQANGSGIIEVDHLQVNNTTISTITTNSDLTLSANGTGAVAITPTKIMMENLPTSDPNVAGQLFRDGTDLKVSVG
jgi:hypothetical protein